MSEIQRLQKNLSLLRTCANWTIQDLADKLEVNRQTISNLESNKEDKKMSKIQYLAIRYCFLIEIEENKNEILKQLFYLLVDHPEEITDNDRKLIMQQAKILSAASKGGSSKKEINDSWSQFIEVLIPTLAGVAFTIGLSCYDSFMSKKK